MSSKSWFKQQDYVASEPNHLLLIDSCRAAKQERYAAFDRGYGFALEFCQAVST